MVMQGKTIYPDAFVLKIKETFGKYSDEAIAADDGLVILGSMLNNYIGEHISPKEIVMAFEEAKTGKNIFADYHLYSRAKKLTEYEEIYDEWLKIYDEVGVLTSVPGTIMEEILS